MSTILKSLKKLEQEKEAKGYPVQGSGYTGPGAVAAASAAPRRKKGAWIRGSLVVLLIVGLGTTSYYFYRQSQQRTPPASDTAAESRPPSKQVARVTIQKPPKRNGPQANPRPMVNNQDQAPQTLQPPVRRSAADPSTARSTPSDQRNPAVSVDQSSLPPSPTAQPTRSPEPTPVPTLRNSQPQKIPQRRPQAEKGLKRIPIGTAPTDSQETTGKSRSPVRTSPDREVRRSDAYDDLRPLTDGRLKIQAIVWSDNREGRMAVINTQIVHEGDEVDGFAVVAVRPDDVVVRGEGGGMYRVRFGHP
ncbi:MAG: general secretion pathway protein GspB [Desulfobacteraceae bacterium]|jgi:hypothetical protein